MCEASTSYPLKSIPYLGKGTTFTREATNDSVVCDIVKNLTEQFADSGRSVTCDTFFTDLNLAEKLLKRNLSMKSEEKQEVLSSIIPKQGKSSSDEVEISVS